MISRFANPKKFFALADMLRPLFLGAGGLMLVAGIYMSFFSSPPDYQQGETVRIMYVHVPAAWMGLFVYVTMAIAAFCGIVWKHTLADLYARAAAPLGAVFTLVCLVTGSLWGRPMWGTWWVWDARLTSVLILFFFYIGYMLLVDAFDDEDRGLQAGGWLLLAGALNIPVVKFSVDWWNTLHQGASVLRLDGPTIDAAMLWPLLLMAGAFKCLFLGLVLMRLETEAIARRTRIANLNAQAGGG